MYHKEEYGHNKKFYDDSDFKKYHSDHHDYNDYFSAHKGGHHKGGNAHVSNIYSTHWQPLLFPSYKPVETLINYLTL